MALLFGLWGTCAGNLAWWIDFSDSTVWSEDEFVFVLVGADSEVFKAVPRVFGECWGVV